MCVGTFDENKFFDGQGSVYSLGYTLTGEFEKDENKITQTGIYKNGCLVNGKRIKNNCMYEGMSNNWKFDGDCKIYSYVGSKNAPEFLSDFIPRNEAESPLTGRLIEQGTYINGKLVSGETYEGSEWHVGKFVDEVLVEGRIYTDYGKKNLKSSGTYKSVASVPQLATGELFIGDGDPFVPGTYNNGVLIEGRLFYNGKWYIGQFEKNFLHGKGKIYSDSEMTKLESIGTFDHDKLVTGTGRRYGKDSDGTRRVCSYGKHENGVVVDGFSFEYPDGSQSGNESFVIVSSVKGKIQTVIEMWTGTGRVQNGKFIPCNHEPKASPNYRSVMFTEGVEYILESVKTLKDYVYTFCPPLPYLSLSLERNLVKTLVYKGIFNNGTIVKGEYYVSDTEFHIGEFIDGKLYGMGVVYKKSEVDNKFWKTKHLFKNGESLGKIED